MTIVNIRLENITTNMQLNYLKGGSRPLGEGKFMMMMITVIKIILLYLQK